MREKIVREKKEEDREEERRKEEEGGEGDSGSIVGHNFNNGWIRYLRK